jgi:hypothetical protein
VAAGEAQDNSCDDADPGLAVGAAGGRDYLSRAGSVEVRVWSDDRNHLLDDIFAFAWFTAIALLIAVAGGTRALAAPDVARHCVASAVPQ